MLDLDSCAVSLVNLAGISHAVAMGRRLIFSQCFLTDQHHKNKNGIRDQLISVRIAAEQVHVYM